MEATPITSAADLPSDGMIIVKKYDQERARGWHIEKVTADFGEGLFVMASPVRIGDGRLTGADPVEIHLRFGLDDIRAMP